MLNRTNIRIPYSKYITRKAFVNSGKPYMFSHGRTALEIGLRSLGLPPEKAILVPEYICNTVSEAIQKIGFKINFYPVRNDLSPDWDYLKAVPLNSVSSILCVHYFGIPVQLEKMIEYSERSGLKLIEDNAHGYGGCYQGTLLGTFGDIGISSPRKSLPLLNGGILYSKTGIKDIPTDLEVEPASVFKLIIKNFIGRILDNFSALKKRLTKQLNYDALEADENVDRWAVDAATVETLNFYTSEKICNKRMEIFRIWQAWCTKNGLNCIIDLKGEMYAPLSCPVLFESPDERDRVWQLLNAANIAATTWPNLPAELTNKINTGTNLKQRILCLPIHLGIDHVRMERILKGVKV